MPKIHPRAIVDPAAEIAAGVEVGPNVFIDRDVTIGPGCRLMHGAHIGRWTVMGADNVVYPGAVIGLDPQDIGYNGEEAWTRIGAGNIFREGVTVHRGNREGTDTLVGDGNFLMANSHVGHNCILGSNIILVNGAILAGHVEVGDRAIISGNCAVHQFVRIGAYSMMRGRSGATKDVPPFCINDELSWLRGINSVGLRRNGFDAKRIRAIKEAFKLLFRSPLRLKEAMEVVEGGPHFTDDVKLLLDFIRGSKRGVGSSRKTAAE